MAADRPPERLPGEAVAEQGVVLLDGPDSVAVAMTPEAARATAASLTNAAALAEGSSPAQESSEKPNPRA